MDESFTWYEQLIVFSGRAKRQERHQAQEHEQLLGHIVSMNGILKRQVKFASGHYIWILCIINYVVELPAISWHINEFHKLIIVLWTLKAWVIVTYYPTN